MVYHPLESNDVGMILFKGELSFPLELRWAVFLAHRTNLLCKHKQQGKYPAKEWQSLDQTDTNKHGSL